MNSIVASPGFAAPNGASPAFLFPVQPVRAHGREAEGGNQARPEAGSTFKLGHYLRLTSLDTTLDRMAL